MDVAAIDWLRFPGGSTNTVSHRYGGNGIMKALKAQAEDKGYHWIDWNVCAEDATASHPDAAQILRNIRRDADGQDTCVVLLHDTKSNRSDRQGPARYDRLFPGAGLHLLYGCTDGCLAM